MKEVERISYYENILNKGSDLVNEILNKLDELILMRDKIKELEKYYYSEERNKDLIADSEGRLPEGLPRGVLGEDYIYDLLMSYDEIKELIDKL